MKLKTKAMSSESKASAYIIGALPFIVSGLICYINYGYMAPFFTGDPMGLFGLGLMQIVCIGGLCWMSIGAFIMAQMNNFEILRGNIQVNQPPGTTHFGLTGTDLGTPPAALDTFAI